MVTILICGDRSSVASVTRHSVDYLEEELAEHYRVLRISEGCLRQNRPGKPDYLLVESRHLGQIQMPAALLILQGSAKLEELPSIDPHTLALIDSSDERAIQLAHALGIGTITLGSGQTDTLSYSSSSDDGMVIALQRSVHSLSGKLYEPAEIPIASTEGYDPHELLLLGCVLLLSDRFEILS